MKTLANLKEATALLALCAALTLSLTSCQKDEMVSPNNGSSFEQASGSDFSQPDPTALNGERNRQELLPNDIAKSSRNGQNHTTTGKAFRNSRPGGQNNNGNISETSRNSHDNAHTGVKPSKITNTRERFNQPGIAKNQNNQARTNEPAKN